MRYYHVFKEGDRIRFVKRGEWVTATITGILDLDKKSGAGTYWIRIDGANTTTHIYCASIVESLGKDGKWIRRI